MEYKAYKKYIIGLNNDGELRLEVANEENEYMEEEFRDEGRIDKTYITFSDVIKRISKVRCKERAEELIKEVAKTISK